MTVLRRALPVLLAAAVLIAGPAQPAAARSYTSPVDIRFPTAAGARYSDDYSNPRSGGRVHRATDLFAPAGARVFAARAGRVIWLPQEEAGNAGYAVQILGDDGRVYAYYHLGRAGGPYSSAVAPKVKMGGTVARGQVIGWLGDSGNAAGGSPHLHFEIHDNGITDPYGGNRVNPYASLRRAQGLPVNSTAAPPPPAPSSNALQIGSRGPAVTRWQKRLNRVRPGNRILADGVFGPGTHQATVAFQRSVGLGPGGLGVVGPKTRRAMKAELAALKNAAPAPAPKPQPKQPAKPKPKTTAPQGTPVLRQGSSGPAVVTWQRQLNRSRMVGRLVADGAFGPATHRATVSFQRKRGLGPEGLGVVGPKTRAQMRQVLRNR